LAAHHGYRRAVANTLRWPPPRSRNMAEGRCHAHELGRPGRCRGSLHGRSHGLSLRGHPANPCGAECVAWHGRNRAGAHVPLNQVPARPDSTAGCHGGASVTGSWGWRCPNHQTANSRTKTANMATKMATTNCQIPRHAQAMTRFTQQFGNFFVVAILRHVRWRANCATPRLKKRGKLANSFFFSTQVLTSVDSSVWTRVCQRWQTRLAKWQTHFRLFLSAWHLGAARRQSARWNRACRSSPAPGPRQRRATPAPA
jgi:hypothetical protein